MSGGVGVDGFVEVVVGIGIGVGVGVGGNVGVGVRLGVNVGVGSGAGACIVEDVATGAGGDSVAGVPVQPATTTSTTKRLSIKTGVWISLATAYSPISDKCYSVAMIVVADFPLCQMVLSQPILGSSLSTLAIHAFFRDC